MVWENDPELFLCRPHFPASSTIYTKRCLDMTKTVPLTDSDFIEAYPYRPSDFQQLVSTTTTWTQPDFERLLDYISPNHYLVNCQGLVFLEVFPFDEIEDIAASVPIYVRLFDVIDLTNYGFHTRPKKVPPRKPKYLLDGYDAQVDNPPVVVKPNPVVVKPKPAVVNSGPKKDKKKSKGGRPEPKKDKEKDKKKDKKKDKGGKPRPKKEKKKCLEFDPSIYTYGVSACAGCSACLICSQMNRRART